MANINFPNGGKIFTQHVSPVILDCEILIGASGAVTSFTGNGVSAVTKSATGTYQLALNQPYNSCIVVVGGMSQASGAVSGISAVEAQNAPTASVSNATTPTLSVKTLAATDATTTTLIATNPVSGSTVHIMAILSNSSVKAGASI